MGTQSMQADIFAAGDLFGPREASVPARPARAPTAIAAVQQASTPAPAPDAINPANLLPHRPSPAWQALLSRVPGVSVEIEVCTIWTGEVLECVSAPGPTRYLLYRDGRMSEIVPDSKRPYRHVWMTCQDAAALHVRHKLVQVGESGTCFARFRFAAPGEMPGDGALAVLDALRTAAAA